jgi:hypothetical protein
MSLHYFEILEEDNSFFLTLNDEKILTNCGRYFVSSPNRELINFIIDDFDRCSDLQVKDSFIDTNILCAYNLFSLNQQMIEHPHEFPKNINHWLYYDEIFYQTGNGPPLEIEQISRLAAPREALASLFGHLEMKELYQYGLAQFYYRSKTHNGGDLSGNLEDWEGPGILISKEQYALNTTVIKIHEAIIDLPFEKKAVLYQLHEMSDQSSILITFSLVTGLISKQQYATAMLANRLEAIEGYLPEVTALDQYEASMEIIQAASISLDYLAYFNPIDDDLTFKVLTLIQNHETKTVEFKCSFFACQETNNKRPIIMGEAAKAIAGFMNGKGGNLLIGVSDDKEIIGLKAAEGNLFKDKDTYTQTINQYLGKSIGKIALNNLNIDFVELSGKTVCLITCPFYAPTYFSDPKFNKLKGWPDNEEVFFLRQEKQTDKLSSKETIDYLESIGKIESLKPD